MRVEDLDTPRVVAGCEQQQLDDLAWLGIDWDEFHRQSERLTQYQQALERLRAAGRIYGCRCSRKQLNESSAPHGPEGPIYPGTCRDKGFLDGAQRFDTRGCIVMFEDLYVGKVTENVEQERGDFVVQRADSMFAYQLAVVVDDIAMGISEVVRGGDLLDSVGRQQCLYEALSSHPPQFAHVPLVLAPSGEKLSKRAPSHTLAGLRALGVAASDVRNWLQEAEAEVASTTPAVRTIRAPSLGKESA